MYFVIYCCKIETYAVFVDTVEAIYPQLWTKGQNPPYLSYLKTKNMIDGRNEADDRNNGDGNDDDNYEDVDNSGSDN